MNVDMLIWALAIFAARVVDVGLGTIRVQLIIRRKKILAALVGFVEVLIFILVVSRVIQDVQNWPYVLAYAGGFAAGTLLGVYLSEQFSKQVMQATVICQLPSEDMEVAVRQAGFALTRYDGTGRDGPVAVIDVVCTSRGLGRLMDVVKQIEPQAFLYTRELAELQGGYVYGLKGKM